jgi:peroxiredoxin Q/BCP
MQKAPNFSLPDQDGRVHGLDDYAGKWLILYFYPEDDTPGCTTEACSFRDDYAQLQEKGLAVAGVSKDSVASHAKFAAKYNLNFPLLADESKAVMEAYGAWGPRSFLGKKYTGATRKTVLINPAGEIAHEYPKVTPAGHAAQILKDFEEMR